MPHFSYLGGEYGRGLLDSALRAPMQTLDGRFLHRTVFDKAAALFRSIVQNHPLLDGNKRTGLTATFVFLLINGYFFWMPRHEAVALALSIAKREIDVPEISSRLRRSSLNFRGRPLTAERLLKMNPRERARYGEFLDETGRLLRRLSNRLDQMRGVTRRT